MKIRCWGARGSIPVSGAEYVLYGGDTTCVEIRSRGDEIIIIDAGSGIRRLGNLLIREKREQFSMVFTHAHWDHILGFPFFKPIYRKGTSIQVFGCSAAQESIQAMISRTMQAPYFPVNFEDLQADISYHNSCESSFAVETVTVTPIPLSHPNQGFGYKFTENGKTVVFLSDNELNFRHPGGLTFQEYAAFCRGADLLIHDAEFTEEEYRWARTWGHSVYTHALQLALETGVKIFGLFHHNQERADSAVQEILRDCRGIVAERKESLECLAFSQETELDLDG
jgi:phosphoribosyl 1,2-cyclic phosphodiesterase